MAPEQSEITEQAESSAPSEFCSQAEFSNRDYVDLALPITTDRLTIRPGGLGDLDSFHARRNQSAVQKYQSWTYPYPRDDAIELLRELEKMSGPTLGEWWMAMIDVADVPGGEPVCVGDVAVHLDESGAIVEIGYNLAPDYWGRGYATEAVAAIIDRLYSNHPGLIRLQAQVHPDNAASAGVVERCGLLFEGQTRLSFIPQDSNQQPSDDRMYSLLRQDWQDWKGRPVGAPSEVGLVPVTAHNVGAVRDIQVHKSQERMVAPVVYSLATAQVPPIRNGQPLKPWYRAVEADGVLVGFVMMAEPTEVHPDPYLWRLSIDRRHQRRGIGRQVLDLIVNRARDNGAARLLVSWVPGPGSPERFYLGYGFTATGPPDDSGEVPGLLLL